jgi:hypothetical protein
MGIQNQLLSTVEGANSLKGEFLSTVAGLKPVLM